MEIGGTMFILATVIISIWVLIEVKRMRHKIFALFLIGMIIFAYVSMVFVFKDNPADIKTASGVIDAGKVYFAWAFSIFGNFKSLTAHTINLDWEGNKSVG